MQTEAILRQYGYEAGELDQFLDAFGMEPEDFRAWVSQELHKKVERFKRTSVRDTRSPRDIMEDVVPEKRHINFVTEPLYDLMAATEKFKHGPFDPGEALPDMLQVSRAWNLFYPKLS